MTETEFKSLIKANKKLLLSVYFTGNAFKTLYKELNSYLVEPQKQNSDGVIEL